MPNSEHRRPAISPNSTVQPFPLMIKPQRFKFEVIGLGSTRSLLLTADETVALKFLLKERVVAKASARLRRYNANTHVSYVDLVEKLIGAGLVHKVDDREFETPYARWPAIALDGVRHWLTALPSAVGRLWETIGSRLLPLTWMINLNRAAISLFVLPKNRRAEIVQQVAGNMAQVLVDRAPVELHESAARCLRGVIRTLGELALLQVAPDDRVCRWVRRSMKDRYDTAALTEALAQGKGAIVFHYHLGPIQYVSLLLSALRFKVTLLGMSMARPRRTRMYFAVVDDLRPAGIINLVRALQKGDVVVISPDVDIRLNNAWKEPAADRNSLFAGYWDKGSRVPVTFLGHRVLTYTGLAWLHEQSGAPVVFAAVERDHDGSVSFRCAPFPFPERGAMTRQEWIQQTMDLVYRRYEKELFAHPDQWGHWLSFFRHESSASVH